jgi:acetylornithine deacetylase
VNLNSLTKTLIDLPSLTGEELGVCKWLADYLAALGYAIELQEVDRNRANLIATLNDTPRVFFSTHLDCVPPHIASSEDETHIYGRGACDAKGIIAAQIFAAQHLREQGFNDIGLLFTVDEEAGSAGAKIANQHPLAAQCRYLINGEPTDNKLAVFSKGSLRVSLHAAGKAAHSAYPEQGESAIEKLLDALQDVRAYAWPAHEVYGATTCNIGVICGGRATNVIAAEARADLHFRVISPVAEILATLEEIAARRAQVEVLSSTEPVKLLALDGFEQCAVRFTTDIPHLSNWGTPLLLGPGSIFDAHTAHERVSKSELLAAVDLYERLARELLTIEGENNA